MRIFMGKRDLWAYLRRPVWIGKKSLWECTNKQRRPMRSNSWPIRSCSSHLLMRIGLFGVLPCTHKRKMFKRHLLTHKRKLFSDKRNLFTNKRDLCIHKRDLWECSCEGQTRDLFTRKRDPNICTQLPTKVWHLQTQIFGSLLRLNRSLLHTRMSLLRVNRSFRNTYRHRNLAIEQRRIQIDRTNRKMNQRMKLDGTKSCCLRNLQQTGEG